ncbi:hypothetical protein Droror1_Dr00015974 [Drosera rotundifolia]
MEAQILTSKSKIEGELCWRWRNRTGFELEELRQARESSSIEGVGFERGNLKESKVVLRETRMELKPSLLSSAMEVIEVITEGLWDPVFEELGMASRVLLSVCWEQLRVVL